MQAAYDIAQARKEASKIRADVTSLMPRTAESAARRLAFVLNEGDSEKPNTSSFCDRAVTHGRLKPDNRA